MKAANSSIVGCNWIRFSTRMMIMSLCLFTTWLATVIPIHAQSHAQSIEEIPRSQDSTNEVLNTENVSDVNETNLRELNLIIAVQQQSFDDLIQQANQAATGLIDQTFAQNPDVTQVAIRVVGERHGQEIPVLTTTVSRAEWRSQPHVEQWATYFGLSARVLLGFVDTPIAEPSPSAQSIFLPSPYPYFAGRGRGARGRQFTVD